METLMLNLSGVPPQKIDTKVLDSESESAKPEMESAKIINDSGFDHELKNEETEEVDMNEPKFMERRAEIASLPEASIEEEDQIKGCGSFKDETRPDSQENTSLELISVKEDEDIEEEDQIKRRGSFKIEKPEAKSRVVAVFIDPQRVPPEPPPNGSILHKDNQKPDGWKSAEDEDMETPFERSKYPNLSLTRELAEKEIIENVDLIDSEPNNDINELTPAADKIGSGEFHKTISENSDASEVNYKVFSSSSNNNNAGSASFRRDPPTIETKR